MTVLLHLSDTHFGTERSPVVAAVQALAREQQPELVIASGDITQRARAAEFQAARDFFDSLGAPLLAIPGNHDIPLLDVFGRVFAPYGGYQRAFGRVLEPRTMLPTAWVAGINTTRPWRHKHGEISPAQAEHAAGWLQGAPRGVLRVIAVHQPPAVQHEADAADLLRGAAQAAAVWAAAGVHLVLGGHIHLPYAMRLPGRLGALPRAPWLAQAGTAVSARTRPEAPANSLNLVRQIGTATWRLERWDFDAASGRFAEALQQAACMLDAA